jgi:DNA-binding NarL/FixJ family response regulator
MKKPRALAPQQAPRTGDGRSTESTSDKRVDEPQKIRLLIVDDHAVVREGLEAMLMSAAGISAIATAADGVSAAQTCATFQPHVALLDLRMPGADGFSVLTSLLTRWPHLRIVMLSASATAAEVALAQRHGAAGYVSKSSDRATLLRAIQDVAAGRTCFAPESATSADDPGLSARELDVLRHLGQGFSNDDLGRALGISGETIKSHLKGIFAKLGVAGRAEAVARAYELGLMSAR